MNPLNKNVALWVIIVLMVVMLYNIFNQQHPKEIEKSYSDFLTMVDNEQVKNVDIHGNELVVTDQNEILFRVYAPQDNELISILRNKGVSINVKPEPETPW